MGDRDPKAKTSPNKNTSSPLPQTSTQLGPPLPQNDPPPPLPPTPPKQTPPPQPSPAKAPQPPKQPSPPSNMNTTKANSTKEKSNDQNVKEPSKSHRNATRHHQ